MSEKFYTSCPLNCWDNCGFIVTVDQGKITKIEGNPNHPITKGKICGRGRRLNERSEHPQRITVPLKKVNGTFEEISWNDVLDEIAAKVKAVIQKTNPLAILNCHDYANSGMLKYADERFFNLLGGVTELEGSLCWGAGIEAQQNDFGHVKSHEPEDIFNSNHIVIWGRNVAKTNLHLWHYLKQAKNKGITITVIDPNKNQTANFADFYIPLKPGTDGYLAYGVIKVIIEKSMEAERIEEYTRGFHTFKEFILALSWNEIEEKTAVSRETMEKLATIYLNRPTSSLLGLGMQRYQNGGQTIRAIDALGLISGNVGIKGGGVNFGNLAVGRSFDIPALTAQQAKKYDRKFKRPAMADEIIQASDPAIEMVVVNRHNPVTQLPDIEKTMKAFAKVSTIVVIENIMTDTAALADYILPCATVFEETDIYYSSMYHGYVNAGPKLIEPPGQAKSDLWIWSELAKRLGIDDDFNYTTDEWIDMGLGTLKEQGLTKEGIFKNNFQKLPIEDIPWKDLSFDTEDHKFHFDNPIKDKLKQNSNREYPYHLLSIHPLRSNHSQHYPLLDAKVMVEVPKVIAVKKGINEGDDVEVYNEKGMIEGKAKLIDVEQETFVIIDEGHWLASKGAVNQLTSTTLSDNQMGSTYYDTFINIRKKNY